MLLILTRRPCRLARLLQLSVLGSLLLATDATGRGQEPEMKSFDIPPGMAADTLKDFSRQSGRGVIAGSQVAGGIRTRAVKGLLSPRAALERMLQDTGLIAAEDTASGAFAIRRQTAGPVGGRERPGAESAGAAARMGEQTLKLDPFEVQADSDRSYGALSSNSITQFNAQLDRLPITADIFNEAFMKDVGSTTIEDMIQTYSAGSGFGVSDPAANASANQQGDRNADSYLTLRGLKAPAIRRDGFMPLTTFATTSGTADNTTTNFDLERVEIINGPQALLYGNGGAGGVINLVSKQARLGKPAFGSLKYQVNQYGQKLGQLDYGMGNDTVGVRVALIDQNLGNRRVNLGGPLKGFYTQVAWRLANTIFRVSIDGTNFDRINAAGLTFSAASTANDARNGQNLNYLVASHQIQASSTGPSGAGPIDNGLIDWDNVDSYAGWWSNETAVMRMESFSADTQWNRWLSSQFVVGYKSFDEDLVPLGGLTFYAPNNPSNPLGVWAMGSTGAAPLQDSQEPARTKAIRFSLLATNDLLGGRVHSQSILGADFYRVDSAYQAYDYYQADANWNPVITPGVTAANGRTVIPKVYWPIDHGLVKYPLFRPATPRITYNGVNYVRMLANPVDPAAVSPMDPVGVTLGGQNYYLQKNLSKGLYGVNYMQWMDNRLDTLAGFRLAGSFLELENQGTSVPTFPGTVNLAANNTFSFDAGADYAVLSWLRPYFSVSDSYDPPPAQANDPYGNHAKTSHGIGEEVGIKAQNASGTISASLAIFHVASQNEELHITSTLENDVNPSGLNGRYGAAGVWLNVDQKSQGVQLTATANPSTALRLRLSAALTDGTNETSTIYNQLYNDQFHENSQGQVTYADGSVVYVNPAFNSKSPVASSTISGAIPLTVGMMSDSSSPYYANPVAITGQIASSSNAATVLRVVDPAHGAILTGVTGVAISQIQINPGFTPPGSVVLAQAGDRTTGYPQISANLTGVYTVPVGWAKGFKIGGTVAGAWKQRAFYYYSAGVKPGALRTIFGYPTLTREDLIVGYERKFGRLTWSTQLNVSNIFNHYHVMILPNPLTGWTGLLDATLDQQPRNYVWTNTISF